MADGPRVFQNVEWLYQRADPSAITNGHMIAPCAIRPAMAPHGMGPSDRANGSEGPMVVSGKVEGTVWSLPSQRGRAKPEPASGCIRRGRLGCAHERHCRQGCASNVVPFGCTTAAWHCMRRGGRTHSTALRAGYCGRSPPEAYVWRRARREDIAADLPRKRAMSGRKSSPTVSRICGLGVFMFNT